MVDPLHGPAGLPGVGRRAEEVRVVRDRRDQPSLKPKKYAKISPIQTGCAEIPIRTKTIAVRSNSERGLSAEKIPTESADDHPEDRAAEDERGRHRGGLLDPLVDALAVAYDVPRSWWIDQPLRGTCQYWTQTGLSSPSFSVARDQAVALAPARLRRRRAPGRSAPMKKITNVTNVIDEEEQQRPEDSPDQISEHVVSDSAGVACALGILP